MFVIGFGLLKEITCQLADLNFTHGNKVK